MRMLAYMFAFWETSKSLSLRSSKSASAVASWQNAFDLLAVHDLLDMALDDAELALLRDEEARGVRAEHLGEEDHAHDAGDDHQAHPDGEVQHDEEYRAQHDDGLQQVGKRLRDHLAQGVDVVGVVRHDVAALVRIEVADGQVLHAVEHLLAQLLKRALGDDRHVAVPKQRGEVADDVDGAEGEHDLQDLGLGGRPVARLP